MSKPPRRRRFRRRASEPFQPLRTLAHIALLQSVYYLSATVLILFTAVVAGKPFGADLVFSWRAVRGDTTVGWTLALVWALCAGVMIIAQLLIISRSKLVLDFSLTTTFLHLLVVSLYEHELPRSVLWWALQLVITAIMVTGGTWACRWRELRPMTFGLSAGGGAGGSGGRSAGRGGDYEMVPITEAGAGDEEEGGVGAVEHDVMVVEEEEEEEEDIGVRRNGKGSFKG